MLKFSKKKRKKEKQMMTKFVNKSRFVSFQAKKVITQIERKKKIPATRS